MRLADACLQIFGYAGLNYDIRHDWGSLCGAGGMVVIEHVVVKSPA